MRFLWAIHLYPPKHNAGAEAMAHTINRYLLSKGHSVRVIHYDAEKYRINQMYDFEGVTVFTQEQERVLFEWADVVLTHLDYSKRAIWTAAQYGKKCYWVAHNDIPYGSVRDGVGDLRVIYNAEWVKNKLNHQWPSFVFPPPVDSWYKCEDKGRNYITLINLNDNKLLKKKSSKSQETYKSESISKENSSVKEASPSAMNLLTLTLKRSMLLKSSAKPLLSSPELSKSLSLRLKSTKLFTTLIL